MNQLASPTDCLNTLCDEYTRLSKRYESLMDSSFEDFKLLTAIGFLVAWPPVATSGLFTSDRSVPILFMGFVGILFIVMILATRDILKASVAESYLQEMLIYEKEIKTRLVCGAAFQFAHNWLKYRKKRYYPIFIRFAILFTVLLLFPVVILLLRCECLYAFWYLVSVIFTYSIYLWTVKILNVL
jgi:hypothetical protein